MHYPTPRPSFTWAFLLLLLVPALLSAQTNDDCGNATPIADPANFCSPNDAGSTLLASASAVPQPACFNGTTGQDVWYSFTAVAAELVFVVNGASTTPGGNMLAPAAALYSGTCPNGLTELACASAQPNQNIMELRYGGLTPGSTYYLRVDGLSLGTFAYCIRNYFGNDAVSGDCPTAVRLCDKSTFNVQAVSGPGLDPSELDDATCFQSLFAESNSTWHVFTAANAGTLTFTLTPNNPGDDLDFVVYRLPNGPGNCAGHVAERCMAAGDFSAASPCMGPTGLILTDTDLTHGPGCNAGDNNFLRFMNLVAGRTYALVVNNFTSSGNGFQVEWGGTAQFVGPKAGFITDKPNAPRCTGEEIMVTDTSSFPSALGTLVGWHWNFGDGATPNMDTTQGPHTVQYATPGIKTLTLTVLTNTGCEVTVTRQIEIKTCCAIVTEVSTQPGCPDDPGGFAIAEVMAAIAPVKYSWSNGQQDSVATGLQAGSYTVTVEDAIGCKDTVSFQMAEPVKWQINFPKDTTIVKGGKAQLTVSSPSTGLQVTWSGGKEPLPNQPSVSVTPDATTVYVATATLGDCVVTDSIQVKVIDEILEPVSAFSPNGDNVNDLLRPVMLGYTLLRLEVWGRWGEKVYDSDLDNNNQGWNGTFNDKPVPADVYFYRAVVRRDSDKEEITLTHDVTLLR
ncbi:MAG TPA: gliding motility-associated C-terminal domain-containing protein [Saprospiraceae bacterium]|nr:gliding motility-associated C-terminal domain-containing protein [Saprospiraceae bacterium]